MTTLATPSAPTVPGPVRGPRAARSATKPGSTSTRRGTAIAGVVAWVVALLFFFPVLWMVLTSFHSEPDAAGNPPKLFAPLTLDGYRTFFGAASGASPWPPLINSAEASVVSTLLVLCLAVPAAYALAVKPVRRWTDVMFFFLSTKMLPVVAGLLPLYIIAKQIGALDTMWYLILLYTAMNLPIAVWMMRSFLAEVPPALFEAASLDGAGIVRTLRSVVVPIASPGIAATALICFIFSWNELLLANTLTSTVAQTAPVFLTSFVTSQGLFLAKVSAAATVISLPVLIAGFAAQDKLVQGLSLGAVK